jgi:hypothetical protein
MNKFYVKYVNNNNVNALKVLIVNKKRKLYKLCHAKNLRALPIR